MTKKILKLWKGEADLMAGVGKNPHTGEKLKIAAVTAPAFKAGKAFKKAVAEKNATK